jgi:hypothetical protein
LGASLRSPFRADGGGVAVCPCGSVTTVPRRAFFAEYSGDPVRWLVTAEVSNVGVCNGVGDERRTLDGSTGGNVRLGFGERLFTWTATPRPIPSVDKNRFWPALPEYEVGGPKSGKGVREPLRFPGVALKTEYSSAKRGVQPVDSSKRPWLCLGVSKTGLGKTADIGVRFGVGGWAVGSPKLAELTVSMGSNTGKAPL